jgi:gamma-glutamyltranspeptidase/glutathione hydrolase
MVTKDSASRGLFRRDGGDMQPQGQHVQVLVNMIGFNMNPQLAGDARRCIRQQRHADRPAAPAGRGTVYAERGISDEVIEELRRRGHVVQRADGGFGGYQRILIDWENGVLVGGSEPRKDGQAVGY